MKNNRLLYKFISILLAVFLFATNVNTMINTSSTVYAAESDLEAEREERKTLPIQTDHIENWPKGPAIGAKSAILMEMNTHTILYAKSIDQKNFPASTTKIFTCLLAMQNCTLDETVTFSYDAIHDVPLDGSKLGDVNEGDTLTMEQALYCILVQSANEVASAVGEHVAEKLSLAGENQKNIDAFADLMNQKAAELGCKNTHFTNANGLHDENHYTTAYDLALIGCEFFNNELLCKISSTPQYHFKLNSSDEDERWMASKNQLYKGKPYQYDYLLGSKTGFVSQSRQTLVSAAEKNGMKLVCVIFGEETPYQFEDTIALFQYGFENFQRLSVSENETNYKIIAGDLFDTDNDLFGDSTPLMSLEEGSYVILPNTAAFTDMVSSLDYEDHSNQGDQNVIATINYTYADVPVGSCKIIFSNSEKKDITFALGNSIPEIAEITTGNEKNKQTKNGISNDVDNVIFINVQNVIIGILILAALAIFILFIISVFNSYSFSPRGQSHKRRRKRRQESRLERIQSFRRKMREKKRQRKRRKEYKKRK